MTETFDRFAELSAEDEAVPDFYAPDEAFPASPAPSPEPERSHLSPEAQRVFRQIVLAMRQANWG